uniref:Junctional sarcoplasmic reticulum protein 1 isoform X2 n=1 Tax=Pogona vitticeps TaxID=103695 RepID=A0ABM5ELY3_9SAUR
MATEPCGVMGQNEDHPELIKEREIPAEETQKQTNKEKQGDAAVMANQEAGISTPNGIEKEEGGSLHVVEKDLDEFVDSVTEVAPSALPEKSPEEAKNPLSVKAPMKAPRAEQIAEKVLRAEKVPEKAPQAEKIPGREKTPEPKAARAEKAPRPQEKKPPEKARPAAPAAKPVRRKTEARGKDTVPWEGLTLNKCLLVASLVAFLSVGCQVFQEIIEYSENVIKTELEAWTSESGVGELEERWFYERWLDWSDDEEPLEMEEDEEEEEEEEEEVLEIEGEEEEEEEEPELTDIEEKEEEEEGEQTEEVPVSKGSPRKSREKAVRREKISRGRARKDHEPVGKEREEEEEEEEEEPPSHGLRHRREGKAKREPQRQEEERKSHHREERDRGKGHPKPERDSRPRRLEPKITPRLSSSLSKEGAHKFGRHKVREAQRQD